MEKNNNTISELEKIRIDCVYGKKKHYNARDRYASYHKRLGVTIVGLTAFIGTSVFMSISESGVYTARIITGIITVTVVVLAAFQTFLNYEKRALTHKVTADRYLYLMKRSQRMLAYHKDGNKTIDSLIEEIETISLEIAEIQKDEPEVTQKDYQKARDGVENSEEVYTDKEKKV